MTAPVQWLRSLVFVGQMYAAMAIMAMYFAPLAAIDRTWAYRGVHTYCRWVRWTARWMVGLASEVRGTPPSEEVLICAKHQSFFDIIILVSVIPRPRFVMKQELVRAPILGWFALRIGCIPVDRGRKAVAIQQMVDGVEKRREMAGQLIIYPQGTRVAPGAKEPYKVGPAILYERLRQTCIPAATNVGVFWPRRGIMRRPGLAVVEFLEPIPPGLAQRHFLEHLEAVIENASDRLIAEGRGQPAPARQG